MVLLLADSSASENEWGEGWTATDKVGVSRGLAGGGF